MVNSLTTVSVRGTHSVIVFISSSLNRQSKFTRAIMSDTETTKAEATMEPTITSIKNSREAVNWLLSGLLGAGFELVDLDETPTANKSDINVKPAASSSAASSAFSASSDLRDGTECEVDSEDDASTKSTKPLLQVQTPPPQRKLRARPLTTSCPLSLRE